MQYQKSCLFDHGQSCITYFSHSFVDGEKTWNRDGDNLPSHIAQVATPRPHCLWAF